MTNLQHEPSLQLLQVASQKQIPSGQQTPVQTPKQTLKQSTKENSKENLKDSKGSKENLKEMAKESKENLKEEKPTAQTPKETPQQTPVSTPHLSQPFPLTPSYPSRDPFTGLPLICVETSSRLPTLSISCLAADQHPFIPLLSIASPTSSQPPLLSPLSESSNSRLVEGESGRLVGLVLSQLTAPTPLAKASKSKSRKGTVPAKTGENSKISEPSKIELSKINENLKLGDKETPSQPSTPVRNPARRSRSLRTPDKMRR